MHPYRGEFRWQVDFVPQELGRWRYHWQQAFLDAPHLGLEGSFDVIAVDLERVVRGLRALREEIRDAGLAAGPERVARFEQRFHALERAAIVLLGPEGFLSKEGHRLRARVAELRAALGSRPLPDAPTAWARPWPHGRERVGASLRIADDDTTR